MIKIKKQGFTLIEVLMVTVISVIFLGVSFSGYRDFTRRQDVLVAKRDVVADLRAIQKYAITGRKPTSCTGTLVGYTFEMINSGPPAQYELGYVCTDLGGGPDISTVEQTVDMSGNISITSPTVNPIIFYSFNRGTNLTNSTSETLTISSAALGISGAGGDQTLTINWTGEIN